MAEREELATVSVMAAAVLMSGRERVMEDGEMRESVRVPPAERAMASSRTVSRLLQMLISFSASCALRMACLVSCSCWLSVGETCMHQVYWFITDEDNRLKTFLSSSRA